MGARSLDALRLGSASTRHVVRMVSMIMRKCLHAWVPFCLACGSEAAPSRFGPPAPGGGDGAGGTLIVGSTGAGGAGIVTPITDAGGGGRDASGIITTLPPGFTRTEVGGYQLGAAIASGVDAGGTGTGTGNCGNIL